jgi:hypothetical protein
VINTWLIVAFMIDIDNGEMDAKCFGSQFDLSTI